MEVTRSNFEEAMELIERVLSDDALEFMSFDEEMTGLGFSGISFDELNMYEDTSNERYEKMREIAQAFGMVQIGLTAWTRNGSGYLAHSWNIYVFPSAEEGFDILLSPSAIEFLTENGMNWEKWISQGVPYLSREKAEAVPPQKNSVHLFRVDDQQFVQSELEAIRTFVNDVNMKSYDTQPTPNAAVARWIHDAVRIHFGTIARSERRHGHRIRIIRLPPNQAAEARRNQAHMLSTRIGARRLFLAMVAAAQRNIPLVGHNCYFDLLFLFSHFDILPETYQEFKRLIHTKFPIIFDTKFIASQRTDLKQGPNHPQGIKTTLSALFDHFQADSIQTSSSHHPVVRFAPSCSKYVSASFPIATSSQFMYGNKTHCSEEGEIDEDEAEASTPSVHQQVQEQYHEAGWDSFVTGIVHLRLGSPPPTFENRLFNLRSNLTIDLANDSCFENTSWQPQGTLYHLKGPIPREHIVRLFPNDVKIHRVAYDGTDTWLLDLEMSSVDAISNLDLPEDVHLFPWVHPSSAPLKARSCSTDDQPTRGPHKRILNWIKSKFSMISNGDNGTTASATRPRKRHRCETAIEAPVYPGLTSALTSTSSDATVPS